MIPVTCIRAYMPPPDTISSLPGSTMPFFTRHSTGAAPRCYRHHHLLFSKPDINQTGANCSAIPNPTAHKRCWNNLLWRCTAVDSTASPHSTTTQICPPQFPSLCQKSPITYRFWLPRQILVNFLSCDSITKILKASDEAVTLTIPESEAVHLSSEYRLAVLARTWTPHLTSFLE